MVRNPEAKYSAENRRSERSLQRLPSCPGMIDIQISQASIVDVAADAIVTAANSALSGGGGVDAAVHRAAGPGLLEECRKLGACPVGSAVATSAHELPARWVIHAVGPVWSGGGKHECELLRSTYQAVLRIADDLGAESLSIPAISCGAYRFPEREAAAIAVDSILGHSEPASSIRLVTLFAFETKILRAYERALRAAGHGA